MNSRERAIASISHKELDRVPIDFGGTTVTGISAVAYKNLCNFMGRDQKVKVFDVMQQLAVIDEQIKVYFGADVDPLFRPKPRFGIPINIHLIVHYADNYLDIFVEVGSNIIIFHVESCVYPFRRIKRIRAHGPKVGMALNPSTSLSAMEYILDQVDLVLVITEEPGFTGQDFIPSMVYKVRALRDIIFQRKLKVEIEVDGHIDKILFLL